MIYRREVYSLSFFMYNITIPTKQRMEIYIMKNLLKSILNLSADHGVQNKDINVIESFAKIASDTVKMESKMNFKPITEAALGANKNFDARNCKSTLGVVETLDAFESFAKNGLVVPTDNSGWKFTLTDLGSTIIKLARINITLQ